MKLVHFLIGWAAVSLIVISHELGHMLCALHYGLAVEEFSLGFGPKLYSFALGDLVCAWRAIPLGGFVRVSLESLTAAAFWHKACFMLAGCATNLAMAALLYAPLRKEQKTKIKEFISFQLKLFVNLHKGLFAKSTKIPKSIKGEFVGPIRFFIMTGEGTLQGRLLYWLVFTSLVLGLINLFPYVFFLDGGRLLATTLALVMPERTANMAMIVVTWAYLFGLFRPRQLKKS
jgi:membrane-associated protease RseP (regulator of RpoE activity)